MPMPARIGKYDVLDLIERGGMGVVYKARDSVLGRMVALKIMTTGHADSSDSRERFLREARAVSMLQHANIVVVHELGEHEGNPYIVMEFLDGDPLHRIIYEHTPISLPQKIDIILQVSKALQYAHQKGIVHRDIKPGNILVLSDGTVKVVDFGLAHLAGSDTITRTGVLVGTFSFMSPEQLNGEPVDARTDIFALGIVFYLLLTGKPPFEGISAAETINKILLEPPPRLEHFQNVNQPELQPVLDKALAKKKEARYQSCSELSEDLSRFRKKFEAEAHVAELERERKLWAQMARHDPDGATLVLDAAAIPQVEELQTSTPAIPQDEELQSSPSSQPESPSQPITISEPAQVATPESEPAARAPVEPVRKGRGGSLKWMIAGLAALVVAGTLYSLFMRRNLQPATRTSTPAVPAPTIPARQADNLSPPPSTSVTSSPHSTSNTSSGPPPAALSDAKSGAARPPQNLLPANATPSPSTKPSTSDQRPANTLGGPETSSALLPAASGKLTAEEMNRRGRAAFQRQEYPLAVAWYSNAADQGFARAQNELGQCYLRGQGVAQDPKKAAELFRKSAEQDNALGEHQLGVMYLRGWGGLPRDYAQALEWFRKSADQNLPIGQFSLGNMYFNGWGLPQDYGQALRWFRKAADQGNPRAQQQLGVMYQNGLGVPKDDTQAQYWFDKAKANRNQQE
jgi:serine/threonine protein kinase